jgi:hypothetical protein
MLCAGSGTAAAQTESGAPAPERSINEFLTMPGDQVVTVPDGTYSADDVVAPHEETNGHYRGWLILVAEHQGGVVVDLSTAPNRQFALREGTSRIAFIGFSFRDGVIRNEAQHLRFWYCDHQDPDYEYLDAKRETPRMFQTFDTGTDLALYGSDFHNAVATPVYFGSLASNVTIQGVRIFDIDPKFGDVLDPMSHIVPMGSPPGSHEHFQILDTYLEGYYTLWGTQFGSIDDMTWQNIWYGFGYPSPFLLQASPGYRIVGATRVNWQIFGPEAELSKNGNDPYIYVDDEEYSGAEAFEHEDRVDITDTNVNYGYPPGVSDEASAQNSPQNPAALWRAAHPYDTWRSFFGWPEPPSSGGPSPLLIAGAVAAICVAIGLVLSLRQRRRSHRSGPPIAGPHGEDVSTQARGVGSYG